MINISYRLKKIASYVKKGARVADIGTDHGLVPYFLIRNNISNFVIASDISKSSLKKTEDVVRDYNLEDFVYPRVGNGLDVIKKDEVDTVIIAGMGGNLIVDILKKDIDLVKSLDMIILQPMQGQEYLRKYLYTRGYEFLDESIVYEDKRYFEIIVVRFGNKIHKVNEIFYKIPQIPYRRKEEILKKFILNEIDYNKSIIKKLEGDSENIRNTKRNLEILNKKYKELLWNIK